MISGRKNGELAVQVHTYREEHQYYTAPPKKKIHGNFNAVHYNWAKKYVLSNFIKHHALK